MAFDPIPKEVRKVWDTWNVRGFIILSLSLQAILILFAPFRKRTSNTFMIFVIWSAYLLADWAAAFAAGLISNTKGEGSELDHNGDLLAFWAPFLLVHLGGPDTITAFALEDNALWLRHLIGLVFQVIAALYILLLTLPDGKLLAPTILMLLAGIIKYAERTRGLYLATLDKFKKSMLREPNPGLNCWKLMEMFASRRNANVPVQIVNFPNLRKSNADTMALTDAKKKLHDDDAVKYAYRFFEVFKGLIVDFIFSVRDRDESRNFFHKTTAEDAYKVILTELNFMYEVLYTKVVVVHSLVGYIFRFLTFGFTIAALVIFTRLTKAGFHYFDVRITYALLISAIAFDSIAMFTAFFSDWNVVNIKNLMERYEMEDGAVDCSLTPILRRFLAGKAPRTSKISLGKDIKGDYEVYDTPLLYRRWGESMCAYNLLRFCIKERPQAICKQTGCFGFMVHITVTIITYPFLIIVKFLCYVKLFFVTLDRCCGRQYSFIWFGRIFMSIFDHFGLMEIYEESKYVSKNPIPTQLWEFIFSELNEKSKRANNAETANEISEARGDWVLKDSLLGLMDRTELPLMHQVSSVRYDHSVLLWHIATDLCYYTEYEDSSNQMNNYRVFSKFLSDYVLYLLLIQPKMMSAVAGIGQIRFMDTCAEAKKFFNNRVLDSSKSGEGKLKHACEMILEVDTTYFSSALKGDQSKSVLFDAAILAKELKKLERQKKDKWEVMFRVWVELLSYAASHCRADAHAQVLSKGGELVTLVWLLMANLGIGEEFHEDMLADEGRATMKIVVSK